MNLYDRVKQRRNSRNGERFYTALDMAIIKKEEAEMNAKVKRGESVRGKLDYIAVCGCGAEGCFIFGTVKEDTIKHITLRKPIKYVPISNTRMFAWGKGI